MITLTALTATLALIIATSVGARRILFDKGHRGAASAIFSKTASPHQVPWPALHVIFAVGLVATFAVFALLGTYNAYVWWCTTSTFFAMITFLFGNLAANILNRHRLRTLGSVVLFALVPSVGIVCDVYILAQSFFIEPWAQPWATGKSVVVFAVACALSASALVASKHRSQKKVRSI